MVPYSLFRAVLDLVGLASTVAVTVWLVFSLQPQLERVKESCRVCRPPEGRALLLWSACLILVAWVAAATLYFRNMFSLWDFMGTCLEDKPINRPVYALLHLYLFFLLACGIYAWAITVFEISQNRKVFNDLFMVARFNTKRYQAIEDLEAHRSSSTDPIDAEAETPSADGNVRNTSRLPQGEDSRRNGEELNEDVTPAQARIKEPEPPTQETAWPGMKTSAAEIVTRTIHAPIRHLEANIDRSVKCSSWLGGGGWNNSDATGPSSQHHAVTLDSDGDTITMTPSSPTTANDSSGIEELEYVDDAHVRYDVQGVRLCEPFESREWRNTNASITIDRREWVEEDYDDDDDPHGLYYATPRLSPLHQNARTDIGPLDIRRPPSPCDSCSSAHAESIPIAKRSPVRVPITPTSPTADADDADTEKTDVERKQRERKNRNSSRSAPQSPHTNTSRTLPPYDTNSIFFEIDPNHGNNEDLTMALQSNIRAHALEQRQRTAASTRSSGKPKPKCSPLSAPALYPRPATSHQGDREAGLFWRSREADGSMNAASRDENFSPVSLEGKLMVNKRTGSLRRFGPAAARALPRRRSRSPYPFVDGRQAGGAEGGRGLRGMLSLEIPGAGLDDPGKEGC